jgi:hypothetical protein
MALAMGNVSSLARLVERALVFGLLAGVTTGAVYLGSWVLRRRLTNAQFWSMFGISCAIWLILFFIASSD